MVGDNFLHLWDSRRTSYKHDLCNITQGLTELLLEFNKNSSKGSKHFLLKIISKYDFFKLCSTDCLNVSITEGVNAKIGKVDSIAC